MKKLKIVILVLLIVMLVGYAFYDTSNESIKDALIQDASMSSLSSPESIIDSISVDNIILCIYQADDGRLGYATIKYTDRSFNKYSVCTNENIDQHFLQSNKVIVNKYTNQGFDYIYGIVVEPENTTFDYEGHLYYLKDCNYMNIRIGVFLDVRQPVGTVL